MYVCMYVPDGPLQISDRIFCETEATSIVACMRESDRMDEKNYAIHINKLKNKLACMHTYIHTYMHAYAKVKLSVCVYMHTYIQICTCVHICRQYKYKSKKYHTYIHTYIHTL